MKDNSPTIWSYNFLLAKSTSKQYTVRIVLFNVYYLSMNIELQYCWWSILFTGYSSVYLGNTPETNLQYILQINSRHWNSKHLSFLTEMDIPNIDTKLLSILIIIKLSYYIQNKEFSSSLRKQSQQALKKNIIYIFCCRSFEKGSWNWCSSEIIKMYLNKQSNIR